MKNTALIKKSISFLAAVFILLAATSCDAGSNNKSPVVQQIYAMDTVMTLTLYSDSTTQEIAQATAEINRLERLFSATIEDSDISRITSNAGSFVTVSKDTVDLVDIAIMVSKMTQGALDISVYPVVKAWGFTTGDYTVPDATTINSLLPYVDYNKITVDRENLSIKIEEGMALDLGAVAKGYTSAKVSALLKSMGETAGVVNLGGNVETLGSKPDGDKWSVAVEYPNTSNYFCKLSLGETSVITSGAYQRNFEQDGTVYHHIIDPSNGNPANNGVVSSTVLADNSAMGDGLSTALYVMGVEKAIRLYQQYKSFDFILLDSNNTVYVTQGLKESFTLAQGYEDLQVKYISK
ncbi:MAG TPA: FAD:protein FMN transferase [Clostridiales bacterium]|nr:FAD:protein FMN transferase [Clostridiales bacterium]